MTTPYERARAVLQTRAFLQELCNERASAWVPEEVRRDAETLLRHYPGSGDVATIAELLPSVFDVRRDRPPILYGRAYWRRVLRRGFMLSIAFGVALCVWLWLVVRYNHH